MSISVCEMKRHIVVHNLFFSVYYRWFINGYVFDMECFDI